MTLPPYRTIALLLFLLLLISLVVALLYLTIIRPEGLLFPWEPGT